MMRSGMPSTIPHWAFVPVSAAVAAIAFAAARAAGNDYVFFAGYTVLQFIVLATAWNILGGYTRYVNFGSGAFFSRGAQLTVSPHKFPAIIDSELPDALATVLRLVFPLPIP